MDTRQASEYRIPQREVDKQFAEITSTPDLQEFQREVKDAYGEVPAAPQDQDYSALGRSAALDVPSMQATAPNKSPEAINQPYLIGQIGLELTALRNAKLNEYDLAA